MAFPESVLDDGESVIRSLRPHWRRIVLPVLLVPIVVFLATFGGVKVHDSSAPNFLVYVILALAVLIILRWTVRPVSRWWSTRYVVTNRRILMRDGVLSRAGRDIPLTRVNDVSFSRTIVERLFRSGTLTIESAGDRGQVVLRDVPRVESVQRDIYRLVEDEAQRLR